jgi:hypothetical protein
MRIEFTGVDPRTHRFRIIRDDGSEESEVLETRSFLVHNLRTTRSSARSA